MSEDVKRLPPKPPAPWESVPTAEAEQSVALEIADLVATLCHRLNADINRTSEIRIRPHELWIRTHDLNERGKKFVHRDDPDHPRYGELAETITSWTVVTGPTEWIGEGGAS